MNGSAGAVRGLMVVILFMDWFYLLLYFEVLVNYQFINQ